MPLILQLCCPRCKRHWKRRINKSGTSPYDVVETACRLGIAVTFDVLGPVDRPCPKCGDEMHYGYDATGKMPWFSLWMPAHHGTGVPWYHNNTEPFYGGGGGNKYQYEREGPFCDAETITIKDMALGINP
jgi:hypothetical protein